MNDQDQESRADFNAILAFALVGTGATLWALAIVFFAIWFDLSFGGSL